MSRETSKTNLLRRLMQKELKFKIITEGTKSGVSKTCKKYQISRTLYYRWLKRYQNLGLRGLEDIKRDFIPENKTNRDIELSVLTLIKSYPTYGPRAIKYLLEEMGHFISESAVYNIMKRQNLTNRDKRLRFARKNTTKAETVSIPIETISSGECWIFWITELGQFPAYGNVYAYTFMDAKSRITCSRIYQKLSYHHFEELLTAVALPIAQSLNMNPKYLCFFDDSYIVSDSSKIYMPVLLETLSERGFEMDIHIMKVNHFIPRLKELRTEYTRGCITTLLPLLQKQADFSVIKTELQHYIRFFNLEKEFLYDGILKSPISYHNQLTHSKPILPIWAYMNRTY